MFRLSGIVFPTPPFQLSLFNFHFPGPIGLQQLFQCLYLLQQFLSFVRVTDAHPLARKVLQQCSVVDIRTGEHRLFAALKRLMFYQLDAVTVIDKRVSRDTCLLLIRLAEPAVYDKTLAIGANRRLAFDRTNGHVTIDNTAR